MLIPGGTGGTDPTSLPRDRFCGQVFSSDQIQKKTYEALQWTALVFYLASIDQVKFGEFVGSLYL